MTEHLTDNDTMAWTYDDGGRREAGYRGDTRDCACRSIAIATGRPYQDIYDLIIAYAQKERPQRRKRSHPRTGVQKPTTRRILADLGWTWVPTMRIGAGCTVHLRRGELPAGRLVVQTSKHLTTVINGVIHDTYDPGRDGDRCVYGYWHKER